MFRRIKLPFRALFRRDDIGDELAVHIEQLADELVAQGLSPLEARRAANRQFGNITAIQEQSRELFSFGLLSDLVRDLTYAGRLLRRAPCFSREHHSCWRSELAPTAPFSTWFTRCSSSRCPMNGRRGS